MKAIENENIQDWLWFITVFLEKNSQINLSAIRTPEWVYKKHILDSLELGNVFSLQSHKTLLDVGTWWWFPLLPLAIRNPNIRCVWIDARKKKVSAVNEIIQKLQIKNAKVFWTRSENYKTMHDYVTVRAVAYIDILFPLVYHLIKPSWYLILYKLFTQEEDDLLKKLASKYYFKLEKTHHYNLLHDTKQRVLYILQKYKT